MRDPKRILLITGPNTGGKTVSMKVIGLFVLMTYVGIPVTAESAVIPFFDNVFVDIGDDQSVVESLSSFSAHIKKQAEIIRSATENSLVLMDEVGSGTDPKEGESLAISILNYLRDVKATCVATTHYGRLKAYGKRHDDIMVASVQFDQEKLEPTYRFIEGLTGQSNAFEIAERYGLPKSIIKYASFLKEQAKSQEDILIERLETQLNETTLKNDELSKKIAEVKALQESLVKERNQLLKEKDEWHKNAQAEANQYIEEAQHIHVKKNQIRPSSHVIPKTKTNTSVHIRSHNIYASMSLECNLIGMRVDEGIEKMKDYMDQAKIHGLKSLRIIHGDGTGKLRKAVHERLRNDKSVKEFRLGMPQEGGTGATVVTLD